MVMSVDEKLLVDQRLDILLAEVREQARDVDGPIALPRLPATRSAEPLEHVYWVKVEVWPLHRRDPQRARQLLRPGRPTAGSKLLGLPPPEPVELGPVEVCLL